MRINISLDKKSIKSAINQINLVKKQLHKDVPRVYLQKCALKIIELANKNIALTEVGDDVQRLIQNSWKISPIVGNVIKISNTASFKKGENLAVFVEFGVGSVGFSHGHILANEANYEYNVRTFAKDHNGYWKHTIEDESLMNIESNYYESIRTEEGFSFSTKGSPATMFLYNAWKEFQLSGIFKTLWEEAKAEVIG